MAPRISAIAFSISSSSNTSTSDLAPWMVVLTTSSGRASVEITVDDDGPGLTEAEQRAQFGFLLDALAMGAPPHGGIALGIDRMTMVLTGEPNLRDVVAFPKNQAGLDPMSGAPTEITQRQLDELGLRVVAEEAKS